MKTLYLLLIVLNILVVQASAQWVQQSSGTEKMLLTLHFLNENQGWAGGHDGTILKTANGGNTWTSHNIGTLDNIHSIFFIDPLIGWAVLYEWTPNRHGSIIHSTDGGESWNVQLSIQDYTFHSIHFNDENNGWVVGSNGIAFHTTNGGITWTQQYPYTQGGWLWPVFFIDNNIGWTAGDPIFGMFKSTDGGNNWSSTSLPVVERVYSLIFLDSQTGWLSAAQGQIAKSIDGGTTWEIAQSGTSQDLRDIYFINYNSGWSVGYNGTIIYSSDGGNYWNDQISGTSADLYSVQFIDNQIGWIVGDNGVILKTNNGGVVVETDILEKTFGGVSAEKGTVFEITNDGGYIISGSTSSFTSDQDMYLIKLDSTASLEWSKVYHSPGFIDRLHGVRQTVEGNYYLAGYIEGGFGFVDHAIIKVDSVGNILWAKNFGGVEAEELREINITADGGVLVSGYNASFGAGLKDVQAIKFFSNGVVDWAKTYGTIWEDFNGDNIIASDGSYVLSGDLDISGSYDIRPTLIKIDTLGNILWSKYYSGFNDDWSRELIETQEGGYLIVGDTKSYGLGGTEDIYLIKTNIDGDVEWAKAYGGIGNEKGYGVLQNSEGNYILSGYTNSFGFGGDDAFLMKVDVIGNLEWFHTYGGNTNDYVSDVKETSDNGYALLGMRSSNTFGNDDVYFIKTDQDGNSICEFGTFNVNVFNISNLVAIDISMSTSNTISVADLNLTVINPNTAENIWCGIIPVELKSFSYELQDNKVLLKWYTATETNNMGFEIYRDEEEIGFVEGHGSTTEEQEYLFIDKNVPSGTYFYSLIQIDYDGTRENIGEIEVVVNNTPNVFSLLQNYPNPFNPTTKIKYTLPQNSVVVLKIFDVLGNEVATLVNEEKPIGSYEVEFDATILSSGIYFYRLQAGSFVETKKMVLMK